jgi:penicillin-binding protein 1A
MRAFKFILKWGFFFSIWIAIFLAILLFYYLQGLPTLDELERESAKTLVTINYSNENLMANRGEIYASKVDYYQLPENLIKAVVAIEDRRFFSHFGVDIFGLMRASIVNYRAGRVVQGGSTISQQLAKLLFLDSGRNFKRKIQELLLALQLERKFSKEQIITFYLNRAYFGSGNYGVVDAAKYYFNKDVAQLNLKECAALAATLKAPSVYSPKNNLEKSQKRSQLVISAMIDAGFLGLKNLNEFDEDASYNSYRALHFYFADFVFAQYQEFLPKKNRSNKNLIIKTTLDENLQKILEEKISEIISENERVLEKSQIAAVILAKDGSILALAGGVDYQKSQFNRAIYAKRQAGSAFKTFVYLAALQKGLKLDDKFIDEKTKINSWQVKNYNDKYLGKITARKAFAISSNAVAAQIARKVGNDEIIKLARKMGIVSQINKNDTTIALGTSEVSLLELTSAYLPVAGDGRAVFPYFISEISNNLGDKFYQRKTSALGKIINQKELKEIRLLLREAVESGTAQNANVGSDIFGKTGTSQNYRDAWFVGFNEDLLIGIWIGNDDNSPTNKITGGKLPAKLFAKIIREMK